MRQKVARDLRKLARQRWMAISPEYRQAFSIRTIYQELKKEYHNEKR